MAFTVRPYRRLPVASPVTYENGWQEGQGIVWNCSHTGWRLSGDLPLALGDICSFTVRLPQHPPIAVLAGVVRWVRGEDVGIETLAMEGKSQAHLGKYIRERMKEL
jgi:hypothetical protein